MITLLLVLGTIYITINCTTLLMVLDDGIDVFEDVFLLHEIRWRHNNLNDFGCVILIIINHIILLPWAIIYWLYKLLFERR